MASNNYEDDNSINYNIKSLFVFSFYIFLFAALLFSLTSWDITRGVIIASAITLVAMPFMYISEVTGRKRHKKIIYSDLFENLKREGYKIEKLGHYRGLIGSRKGYGCRLYYEWSGDAKGFLSFGDMVLIVYYQPLLTEKKVEGYPAINDERIDELNGQYGGFMVSPSRTTVHTPCYVKRNIN